MTLVGIVDDHAIVRSGLRELLSAYDDIAVVGEALNGRAAVDLVRTISLDVLVMDLGMPGQSGLDALVMIQAKAPNVAVLVFSGYPTNPYALSLLRQGASGYLNKDCEPTEVVHAIRHVAKGLRYISNSVAELMAGQLSAQGNSSAHSLLSERELQVFLKLARGDSTGDIAKTLSLSPKTVSTYRGRVMEKLQLTSNSDLTYYALKQKLLD